MRNPRAIADLSLSLIPHLPYITRFSVNWLCKCLSSLSAPLHPLQLGPFSMPQSGDSSAEKEHISQGSVTTSQACWLPSEIHIPYSLPQMVTGTSQPHPSPDTLPHPLPFNYLIIGGTLPSSQALNPCSHCPHSQKGPLPLSAWQTPTHLCKLSSGNPAYGPAPPASRDPVELPSLLALRAELCCNTSHTKL